MEDNLLDLLFVRGFGEKKSRYPEDDQNTGGFRELLPGGIKFFLFGFSFSIFSLFATLKIIKTKLRPSLKPLKKLMTGVKEIETTIETDFRPKRGSSKTREREPATRSPPECHLERSYEKRCEKTKTLLPKTISPRRGSVDMSLTSKHFRKKLENQNPSLSTPTCYTTLSRRKSEHKPFLKSQTCQTYKLSPRRRQRALKKSFSPCPSPTPTCHTAVSTGSGDSSCLKSQSYQKYRARPQRQKRYLTKSNFEETKRDIKYISHDMRRSKPRRMTNKLPVKKMSQDDSVLPLIHKTGDSNQFKRYHLAIEKGGRKHMEHKQNHLINDPRVLHQSINEDLSGSCRGKQQMKAVGSSQGTSEVMIDEFDDVSYLMAAEPQDHLLFSNLTPDTDTISYSYGVVMPQMVMPQRGQGEAPPGYWLRFYRPKRQVTTDEDSDLDDVRYTSEFATQSSNTFTVEEAAQNLLTGVFTGQMDKAAEYTSDSSQHISKKTFHEKHPTQSRKLLTLGKRVCSKTDTRNTTAMVPTIIREPKVDKASVVENEKNKEENNIASSAMTGLTVESPGHMKDSMKESKTENTFTNDSDGKISRVRLSIRKSKNTGFDPHSTSDLSGILKKDAMLAAYSPVSKKLMELRDAIIHEWKQEKGANKDTQKTDKDKDDVKESSILGKLMEQTKPLANVEITKINTRKRKGIDDTDIIESHIFCHSQETLSPELTKESCLTNPCSTKKSLSCSKKVPGKIISRDKLVQLEKNEVQEAGGKVDACTSMTCDQSVIGLIPEESCHDKIEGFSKTEQDILTNEKWRQAVKSTQSNEKDSKSLQSRTGTSALKQTIGEPSFTLRPIGLADNVNGVSFKKEWVENATEINKQIQSIFNTNTAETKPSLKQNLKCTPLDKYKTERYKWKKPHMNFARNDASQMINSEPSNQKSILLKSKSSRISKGMHNPDDSSNVTLYTKSQQNGERRLKGKGDISSCQHQQANIQIDEDDTYTSHASQKVMTPKSESAKERKRQLPKKLRLERNNETEANSPTQGDNSLIGTVKPSFLKKENSEVTKTKQTQKGQQQEEFVKERKNHSGLQSQMPKLLKQRPRIHNRYNSEVLKFYKTKPMDTNIKRIANQKDNAESKKNPDHSIEAPVTAVWKKTLPSKEDDTNGKPEQKDKANHVENHNKKPNNFWLPKLQQMKYIDAHVGKKDQGDKPDSKRYPVQTRTATVTDECNKCESKVDAIEHKDTSKDVDMNLSLTLSSEKIDQSQSTLNMLSSFSIAKVHSHPGKEDHSSTFMPKATLHRDAVSTGQKEGPETPAAKRIDQKGILSNVCMVESLNSVTEISEAITSSHKASQKALIHTNDKEQHIDFLLSTEKSIQTFKHRPMLNFSTSIKKVPNKQKQNQKDKETNATVTDVQKRKIQKSRIPRYLGNKGSKYKFRISTSLLNIDDNLKNERQVKSFHSIMTKPLQRNNKLPEKRILNTENKKTKTNHNQQHLSLLGKHPRLFEKSKGFRAGQSNIIPTVECKQDSSPIKYLMKQSEPIIIIAPHLDRTKLNIGNYKHFIGTENSSHQELGKHPYHPGKIQDRIHGNKTLRKKSLQIKDKAATSSTLMRGSLAENNQVFMKYKREDSSSTSYTSQSWDVSPYSQEKIAFRKTLESIDEEEQSEYEKENTVATFQPGKITLKKKKTADYCEKEKGTDKKYELSHEEGQLVEKIFSFWQSNLKIKKEHKKFMTKANDSSSMKNENIELQHPDSIKKTSPYTTKKNNIIHQNLRSSAGGKKHDAILSLSSKQKADNLKKNTHDTDLSPSKWVKTMLSTEYNSPQKRSKEDASNKLLTHSNINMSTSNTGAQAPLTGSKRKNQNTRGYLRSTHSYDQKKIKSDTSPKPTSNKSRQTNSPKKEQVNQLLSDLQANLNKQLKGDGKNNLSQDDIRNIAANLGLITELISPRQNHGDWEGKKVPSSDTSPEFAGLQRRLLAHAHSKKETDAEILNDQPEINGKKIKPFNVVQTGQNQKTYKTKGEIWHTLEQILTSKSVSIAETSPPLRKHIQDDSPINRGASIQTTEQQHKSKILNELVTKMMKLVNNDNNKSAENSFATEPIIQKRTGQETHTLRSSASVNSMSPTQIFSPSRGGVYNKTGPVETTKSRGDDTFSLGSKRSRQRHFTKHRLLKWGEFGTSNTETSKVKRLTKASLTNSKQPLENVEFTSHASITPTTKDRSKQEHSKFSSPELLTMPRSKVVRINNGDDPDNTSRNKTTAEDTLLGSSKWSVEGLSTDASPLCSVDPDDILLPDRMPNKLDKESNEPSSGTPNLEMYKQRIVKKLQTQATTDMEIWDSGHETSHVDKLREKYLNEIKMRLNSNIDRVNSEENISQHETEHNYFIQDSKLQSPEEIEQFQSFHKTRNYSLKKAKSNLSTQAITSTTRGEYPYQRAVTFDKREKRAKINVVRKNTCSNDSATHREQRHQLSPKRRQQANRTMIRLPSAKVKGDIFNLHGQKTIGPYNKHDKALGRYNSRRTFKHQDKKSHEHGDKKGYGRLIKPSISRPDNNLRPYHSLEEHLQQTLPTKASKSEDMKLGKRNQIYGSGTETYRSSSPTRTALQKRSIKKRTKAKRLVRKKQGDVQGSISETFKTSSPIRTKVRRIKGINTDFNENFFLSHTHDLQRKPSTIDFQSKGNISKDILKNESISSSANCDLSWFNENITDGKGTHNSTKYDHGKDIATVNSKHGNSLEGFTNPIKKENRNCLKPEFGILKFTKPMEDSWKVHEESLLSPLGDSPTDKGISELPNINETETDPTHQNMERSLTSPDSIYLAAETQRNTVSNSNHQNYQSYHNFGGFRGRCVNADTQELQTYRNKLQCKDSVSQRDQYVASALKQERKTKNRSRSQDRVQHFHQLNNSAQFFHLDADYPKHSRYCFAQTKHNVHQSQFDQMENLKHKSISSISEPSVTFSCGGMKNNNKPMSNSSQNDSLLQYLHTGNSTLSQSVCKQHKIDQLSPVCGHSQRHINGQAYSETCSLQDHLRVNCQNEVSRDDSTGAASGSGDPEQPYSINTTSNCRSEGQQTDQCLPTSNQADLDWYKPLSNAETHSTEAFHGPQSTSHEDRRNQRISTETAGVSGLQASFYVCSNYPQDGNLLVGNNVAFPEQNTQIPEEVWQMDYDLNHRRGTYPPWYNYCRNVPTQYSHLYKPNSVRRQCIVNPIQNSNECRIGPDLLSHSQAAERYFLPNCQQRTHHLQGYFNQNRSEGTEARLANNSLGLCRPRVAFCQSNDSRTSLGYPVHSFGDMNTHGEQVDFNSAGFFEQSHRNVMSSGLHQVTSLNDRPLLPNPQELSVQRDDCFLHRNKRFMQQRCFEPQCEHNDNTFDTHTFYDKYPPSFIPKHIQK